MYPERFVSVAFLGFILVASKVLTRVERKHYVCKNLKKCVNVLTMKNGYFFKNDGAVFLSLFTRVLGQFDGAPTPTTLLHLVGFWTP